MKEPVRWITIKGRPVPIFENDESWITKVEDKMGDEEDKALADKLLREYRESQTFQMLKENHGYYEALRVRDDWTDEGSVALNRTVYSGFYTGIVMPRNITSIKATHRWRLS